MKKNYVDLHVNIHFCFVSDKIIQEFMNEILNN